MQPQTTKEPLLDKLVGVWFSNLCPSGISDVTLALLSGGFWCRVSLGTPVDCLGQLSRDMGGKKNQGEWPQTPELPKRAQIDSSPGTLKLGSLVSISNLQVYYEAGHFSYLTIKERLLRSRGCRDGCAGHTRGSSTTLHHELRSPVIAG